ncbi:MAG TPA: SDR family oxidoreductase, partial [Mycobacteriales bacterium]|nr:SDR family oxidoreductase [Mycobacteriales bacterium]
SGVYNATKHAVNAFSESLRQEVTGRGVRVVVVEPGAVATELRTHITQQDARETAERRAAAMRQLTSQDVAAAILWAVTQPEHVSVNEVLIRPTDQDW